MTRFAITGGLLLALAALAAADDKKDAATPLEGSWKVVEASVGGKPEAKERLSKVTFTFAGGKLTVADGSREPDAGTFAVDPKAEPARIDIGNAKGDNVAGIYKIDKDGTLTVAFPRNKGTTRPKSFDDKDAVVVKLEKVKKP